MFTLLGNTLFALSFLFYPAMAALLDFLLEILATIAVTYTFVCRLIPSPSTVSFFLLVLEMILQYSLECSTRLLLFIRISGLSLADLAGLMLKEYLQETSSVVSQYTIAVHDVVIDPAVHTFMWSLVGFAIMGLECAHRIYVAFKEFERSIVVSEDSCSSCLGDLSGTTAAPVSHLDIEGETKTVVKILNSEANTSVLSPLFPQSRAPHVALNSMALEFVPRGAGVKLDINGRRIYRSCLNPLAELFISTIVSSPAPSMTGSSTAAKPAVACSSLLNPTAPVFVPSQTAGAANTLSNAQTGLSVLANSAPIIILPNATAKPRLSAMAEEFVPVSVAPLEGSHTPVRGAVLCPTAAIFVPGKSTLPFKASLNVFAPVFIPASFTTQPPCAENAEPSSILSDVSASLSSVNDLPLSTSFASFHFVHSSREERRQLQHSVSSLDCSLRAAKTNTIFSSPSEPSLHYLDSSMVKAEDSLSSDASLTFVEMQSLDGISTSISRGVKKLGLFGLSTSMSTSMSMSL
ncbi:hypothetical protein BV25DRAFT_1990706 [Artomyces pyxidatus]|uniref:Uncharacterized protein n=1 Tax=Artomyces pyxidatus TaxID=48021 RepID=A0ACB8T449_9AGAM|nr:hypothetical protein BV25DRAFT_1990706 [Artomyces pyxidatus]